MAFGKDIGAMGIMLAPIAFIIGSVPRAVHYKRVADYHHGMASPVFYKDSEEQWNRETRIRNWHAKMERKYRTAILLPLAWRRSRYSQAPRSELTDMGEVSSRLTPSAAWNSGRRGPGMVRDLRRNPSETPPMSTIAYRDDRDVSLEQLVSLYRANHWSSAEKGEALRAAIRGSHSVVTAWADGRLVGLGNALSDGHLVVYYPHLLVPPRVPAEGHRRGGPPAAGWLATRASTCTSWSPTGRRWASSRSAGSRGPGGTSAMWIYSGGEH